MRKEETVTVCDRCGEDGAKSWTVTDTIGDRYYVELCQRHGQELRSLCQIGTPAKKGPFGTKHARLKAKGEL